MNPFSEQLIAVYHQERLAAAERQRVVTLLVRARRAARKADRAAGRAARAQHLVMAAGLEC